jgi:hypothetical protein
VVDGDQLHRTLTSTPTARSPSSTTLTK